ncbi:PREDICTED: calmodulin [Prunus dulcis]|uniref:PREDICTED: calmodulin n=1 Tax=Prunus dulcis TaxID=3755 RepID=A0A5E4EKQ4_PRUDU|nr:PREDICTED: calmodulin [Prunus dulcis]
MEALAALLRISLAVMSRNLAFNTTEKGFPIYENLNQIWKKMGNDMSDKLISSIKEAFTLSSSTTTAQHKSIATEEKLTAPFNFPHFLDLMGKHMKPTTFDRQLCDTFKILDKDSTGFVFVSELRHILTSINEKLEPSEFASRSGRSMSGPVPSEKRNAQEMISEKQLRQPFIIATLATRHLILLPKGYTSLVPLGRLFPARSRTPNCPIYQLLLPLLVNSLQLQLFFYPFAKLFFDALSFH